MTNYRSYFGLKSEPFTNDISTKNLLKLPAMVGVKERIDYVSNIGGIMLITGEVGSGKSTAIRWALSHYHPSQYNILSVIATSGAVIDIYRQIAWALNLDIKVSNRPFVIRAIKSAVTDLVQSKKQIIILVIDEANLLRSDVFAELHTLTQFNHDSQNMITVILAGQVTLIDKLMYRLVSPLASRVIARSHLAGINHDQMTEYLMHHLNIASVKKMLFDNQAITAIQQGSGGLLRKANALARGGLIAASAENQAQVSAEHIRIASTELI
jgi:type II secretory pathway predicted ATPase ExeA